MPNSNALNEKIISANKAFDNKHFEKAYNLYLTVIRTSEFKGKNVPVEQKCDVYFNTALAAFNQANDGKEQQDSDRVMNYLRQSCKYFQQAKGSLEDREADKNAERVKRLRNIEINASYAHVAQAEHYLKTKQIDDAAAQNNKAFNYLSRYKKEVSGIENQPSVGIFEEDLNPLLSRIYEVERHVKCFEGDSALEKGDYQAAIGHYLNACKYQIKQMGLDPQIGLVDPKKLSLLAAIKYNLGTCYEKIANYDMAYENFKSATVQYKEVWDQIQEPEAKKEWEETELEMERLKQVTLICEEIKKSILYFLEHSNQTEARIKLNGNGLENMVEQIIVTICGLSKQLPKIQILKDDFKIGEETAKCLVDYFARQDTNIKSKQQLRSVTIPNSKRESYLSGLREKLRALEEEKQNLEALQSKNQDQNLIVAEKEKSDYLESSDKSERKRLIEEILKLKKDNETMKEYIQTYEGLSKRLKR